VAIKAKQIQTKFMKVDYNQKLLTKLAGLMGAIGASFLTGFSAEANEVLNPNFGVFSETSFKRGQLVLVEGEYTPTERELAKQVKVSVLRKNTISQRGTNPRPSIFDQPPYNRTRQNPPSPITPTVPTPTTPEATPTPEPTTQSKNLVAIAEADGSFKTLTKALTAAGLTEILQGKESYTIFAPTDAAFAKLPQDAVRDLLKPENKEVLVKLLTYHVVQGQVLSIDLKSGEVKSYEGGAINVKVDPKNGVTVNDAKVTKADIIGSNGVIHAIDQVILPPDL
jgi:uncharacterized surface protein with fasciclin (FAS1) repeats